MRAPVRRLIATFTTNKDNGPETRIRAHMADRLEQDPTIAELRDGMLKYLRNNLIDGKRPFLEYYDVNFTSPGVMQVRQWRAERVVATVRLNPAHPETKGGRP